VLLATPHLEPSGLVVAVTGSEIVAQLLTNAQTSTAANAFNVNFIREYFILLINDFEKYFFRQFSYQMLTRSSFGK
jgi:hypothetical protein